MNTQIIILAAGQGTRMGHSELPKVLVPLANKPIIFHLLEEIKKLGESIRLIIIVGYKYQLVQSMLGPNYLYAFQEGQFGTGHAVAAAKNKVTTDNVLVLFGDMPFIKAKSINTLVSKHESGGSILSMFTANVPNFANEFATFNSFGRIIRNQDNKISEIVEFVDATEEQRGIKEVNPSIYIFKTQWLWDNIDKIQKNKHGEYYLTDIVSIARRQKVKINSLTINPLEVFGINTPEHLEQAEKFISGYL